MVRTGAGVRGAGRIVFGLIAHALRPLGDTLGTTNPDAFAQFERGPAVVVGAEALSSSRACAHSPPT
ncbi:hypothetical protein QFZ75_000257 [Streptomyces sp. V3I8]|nr:hypothetical protein [Streptomyces sp. V3I8]